MRGFVAVLAGLALTMAVVVVFTWTAAVLMGVTANNPTPAYITVNLVISGVAAFAGGYLTGRVATSSPLMYAAILGGLLFLMGLPMIIGGPQLGQPNWYPVAIAVIGAACAVGGGALARATENAPKPRAQDRSM